MKSIWGLLMMMFCSSLLLSQYDHKDILPQLEGETLLQDLVSQFSPSGVKSYSDARFFMFKEVYNQQDSIETIYAGLKRYLDPNESDPIQYFLTGDQNLQVDTEHSYPRSKGADRDTDAGSDLHHLFPARKLINSSRGNLPFGEVSDSETETWYLSSQMQSNTPRVNIDDYSELGPDRFEPREIQKGNIARAMFYFYTIYRNQANAADPQFFEVMREDICDWHYNDPVDSLEWERSKMIGEFQGHEANPFVLDCSLAARLYCDEISDACAFLTSVKGVEIKELKSFPNPVKDILKIDLGDETIGKKVILTLFDMLGKNYMTVTSSEKEVILNLTSLPPGMYHLVARNGPFIIGKQKLIRL